MRVVPGDQRGQLAAVAGQGTWEPDVPTVLPQPGVGFIGSRTGQAFVLVPFDHHREIFAAGQGLLGFDLGAEPGGRG